LSFKIIVPQKRKRDIEVDISVLSKQKQVLWEQSEGKIGD